MTGRLAYDLPFKPVALKALALDCGLSQVALRERVSRELGREVSRPTINLTVNKGYEPLTIPGFRAAVERVLAADLGAVAWLTERGLTVTDVWQPLGAPRRNRMPAGHAERTSRARRMAPPLVPGDPLQLTPHVEVEMLAPETLKHFRLFRNPFIDDVRTDADVYLSDEHRYAEQVMLEAAAHAGFVAVVGEVGSGKSVIRRKVVAQLKRDGKILVIYPQMIDKTRLTAGSICDAIIQDVSDERCKSKLEDKTRQVTRLLLSRAKEGFRAVLLLEEAHDLNVQTLKYLKRFYELEDGFTKLLGIVLIGQTELKHRFDEAQHIDMREVIRRVQIAEIAGLNGHLQDYLALKFKRLNRPVAEIFAADAFEALSRRLSTTDRGRKISHAYPLMVNNCAARAMNLAAELGEPLVTAAVVEQI